MTLASAAQVSRAAFVVGGTATLALGTSVAARAADTFTMKLGLASINDQQHEWVKMFKAIIEKDSGGRIKAEIYPSSQLGSIPRMVEGVQFNSIQGFIVPPEFLNGLDVRYEIFGIPDVFRSPQNMTKTLGDPELRKEFLAIGSNKGIVGIGLIYNDSLAVLTRKPVNTLADLRGLKLRVTAGPVLSQMMSAIGASGVPMPLDQVITAVQQGAIDGLIATTAVMAPMKIASSAPYTLNLSQAYAASIAIVSKQFFDSLPTDLQKLVVAAGARVDKQILPFIDKYLSDQRAVYTNGGGKIVKLSPADDKQLDALWAPVGKDIVAANPSMKSIYDVMENAAARNR